jgi:hypothetical protein
MENRALAARWSRSVRQLGLMRTLYDLLLRVLNRLVFLRVLRAMAISTPDPKALERRPEYSYGFLSRALVLSFAVDPQYEMNEAFLRGALAKNDRCYGIVDGETLASYGWYSTKPTVALTDDLELRFDPSYVYMYKGFTHAGYRGQRLHAAGMALALQDYRTEGLRGIVSYVESNNFSSLKSCYRMGYEDFGRIVVLRVAGRYFVHSSKGCKSRGFGLVALGRAA